MAAPTEHPPKPKPLVGVNELVRETGLSDQAIRHHLESGDWPSVRIGRRGSYRVPRAVLEMLLRGEDPAALKAPPPPPA